MQAGTAAKQDAEALLKADHRKVEQLFQQYKNAGEDSDKKSGLAHEVCKELIVHSKLEEELFYPACREKDVDDDLLDEAQVEHDGAKIMIAELMNGSPDDDYYDAKLTVLSEYIKHHVGEEEKPGDGIFAKARKAGVDMNALGARLQARKSELMANIEALSSRPPQPRSLNRSSDRQTNQENFSMARYSNDRDRDEHGRFTSEDDHNRGRSSSRGGYSSRSSRDYDDDRGNGRRSSSSNDRERDDQGRFMSEDDNGRGNGRRSSSSSYRERDDQGRFMSDDDDNGRGNGRRSSSSNERDRDEYGRFTSEDDDNRSRSSSRGGYSSRSGRDDDDDRSGRSSRGRGQGGWFGDSEGHSEAAERGWEGRESSRGGYSSRSSRDDDDDRGGRSSRSSSGRGGQGHGGWFGDSEGHSEAAERGWEGRQSSRGGYSSSSRRSSRDDDDNDRGGRSSRSGGGNRSSEGHGGWFGDSRGHAEAARKGWQDR